MKPFHLETDAELSEIRAALASTPYTPGSDSSGSTGWGSIADTEFGLGQGVETVFEVTPVSGRPGAFRSDDVLAARFYWWTRNPAATRRFGSGADPRLTHQHTAADVILFRESSNLLSGVVTVRETAQFRTVVEGLSTTLDAAGIDARVTTDTLPERAEEDFFLWLLYRLQSGPQLSANLFLSGIQEISSKDRQYRGARFQDEATVERIELAALVGLGIQGFGPAKFTLLTVNPDAEFSFELHADGGFQPYRRSSYEARELAGTDQAIALIEDLWTLVLPQLRVAYASDSGWNDDGRARLRGMARDRVIALLNAA